MTNHKKQSDTDIPPEIEAIARKGIKLFSRLINEIESETPIMDAVDAKCDELNVMDAICYAVYEGQKLEEKLNEANHRIKRLEEAGDVMYKLLDPPSISMRTTEYDNALQGWDDAKIK